MYYMRVRERERENRPPVDGFSGIFALTRAYTYIRTNNDVGGTHTFIKLYNTGGGNSGGGGGEYSVVV